MIVRFARAVTAAILCALLGGAVAWQAAAAGLRQASPVPATGPGAATPAEPTALRRYRLLLLVPRPDEVFWQDVEAAARERAAALGVELDVVGADAPSAPEQLAQVAVAADAGYDGLLLGPADPIGAVPALKAAAGANLPVVVLGDAPAAGEPVAVVATDHVAAAAAAGEWLAEAIGGEGRVLLLGGDPTDLRAQQRGQGLRTALAEYPAIAVVDESAGWDPILAAAIAGERLPPVDIGTPSAGDPELRAIIAASDEMALAALDTALAAGRDEILVVGFGGTADALAAVEAGELAATVAETPLTVGAVAVETIVRHLNGEPPAPRVDAGFRLVVRDGDG